VYCLCVLTVATPQEAGEYIVEAHFLGTFGGGAGQIRGSPVAVVFDDFAPRANNQFSGKLVLAALKADVDGLVKRLWRYWSS